MKLSRSAFVCKTVSETKRGPRVGIVFDVGGRGDKSFNDGAYSGADRARRELAAEVRYIEPGDGSDREANARRADRRVSVRSRSEPE